MRSLRSACLGAAGLPFEQHVRDRKNDHKHKQRTEFGGEADHGEFGAERTVEATPPRNSDQCSASRRDTNEKRPQRVPRALLLSDLNLSDPKGIRTPVLSVRGICPRPG